MNPKFSYFFGFINLNEKVKSNYYNLIISVSVKLSELNVAIIQLNGEKQNFILNKKDFKTGSRGYHGQGKMKIGEKKYQINILCIEIGSKQKTN